MTIDEAKKRIQELEDYIELIENYQADTIQKEAIKLYVQLENVSMVADELNEKGYRMGQRKVISKDVSEIIRNKPIDELHSLAKKMFSGNRRRSNGIGWI